MIDYIMESNIDLPKSLALNTNIDGLPIYNSSKGNFWPILGKFQKITTMNPFVIGIYYHEEKKPKCVHIYLKDFIEEMSNFEESNYKGIKVNCGLFIMDASERADMKMIKHPTDANACPYCNAVGVYLGRICFPLQISEPRTDDTFRNREDILHHNSRPDERGTLEHLNIDMIKNFPPDYLHVVCIGVVKKLECLLKN